MATKKAKKTVKGRRPGGGRPRLTGVLVSPTNAFCTRVPEARMREVVGWLAADFGRRGGLDAGRNKVGTGEVDGVGFVYHLYHHPDPGLVTVAVFIAGEPGDDRRPPDHGSGRAELRPGTPRRTPPRTRAGAVSQVRLLYDTPSGEL